MQSYIDFNNFALVLKNYIFASLSSFLLWISSLTYLIISADPYDPLNILYNTTKVNARLTNRNLHLNKTLPRRNLLFTTCRDS